MRAARRTPRAPGGPTRAALPAGRGELGHHQAHVARGGISPMDFGWRHAKRLGDGLFDRPFAEAELDRFIQRRHAALQQIADLGNLVGVDLLQQLGEQGGQLFAAGGVLQFFEALRERGKAQHRQSIVTAGVFCRAMETRRLGASGLDVPVVGMGTWKTFDVRDPHDVAQRQIVVDVAQEHGSNLFDSSPMYGAAEQVLGSALARYRAQALVATKVWSPDDAEADRQIERALGYFGGVVDVYQVHNLVAWPKRLSTLERLRDNGLVRAVGVTNGQHAAFPDLMEVMRSGRISCVQVPYNALDRVVEERLLPLAAELGIGVIVMRPLGAGTLADALAATRTTRPVGGVRRGDLVAGAAQVAGE